MNGDARAIGSERALSPSPSSKAIAPRKARTTRRAGTIDQATYTRQALRRDSRAPVTRALR